jgi:hypothetical protein
MNESREGMLTLNWDEVGDAIGVFEEGAETVALATLQIQQPTTSTSSTPEQDISMIFNFLHLRYSEASNRTVRHLA